MAHWYFAAPTMRLDQRTSIYYMKKSTSLGSITQTRNLKSHRLMKKEILIMAVTNKRRLKPELEFLQVYGDTPVGWDENAPPNWIRGPMWRQCVKRLRMTLSPYRLGTKSSRSRNMTQLTWPSFPTRFWTRLSLLLFHAPNPTGNSSKTIHLSTKSSDDTLWPVILVGPSSYLLPSGSMRTGQQWSVNVLFYSRLDYF